MPFPVSISSCNLPFYRPTIPYDFRIRFTENKALQMPIGKKIYEGSYDVILAENERVSVYRTMKKHLYLLRYDSRNEYEYIPVEGFPLDLSHNLLAVISIESILLSFRAFILHASFIRWKNKAILFSAPSGTGKSTQADLWERYENAEIINGDRAAVRIKNNQWSAFGLPVAGSSRIYKNESAQVAAIIILRQGKHCSLRRAEPREAFTLIYSETTVHVWDEDYQVKILDLLEKFVLAVPIYIYECTPDREAVEILKQEMLEKRIPVIEGEK